MSDNPYANPQSQPRFGSPPPQKKGMSCLKMFLIFAGIFGFMTLLCVGCGFGLWVFGTGVLEDAVARQFGDHPIVQRELGEEVEAKLNFWESVLEKDARGGTDEVLVFDVSGSEGSGRLIVEDQVGERFRVGTLVVDGQQFDVSN